MKKLIIPLACAVIAASAIAQQFSPNVSTVTNVPPLTITGASAPLIIGQLLAITNAAGQTLIPPGMVSNRNCNLSIRIQVDNTGAVRCVTAEVH